MDTIEMNFRATPANKEIQVQVVKMALRVKQEVTVQLVCLVRIEIDPHSSKTKII